MGCVAYWFLFMSWSHSYAAPSFQFKQTVLLGLGTALILAGAISGVWTLARRKGKRRDDNVH
jgi:hypothetical protein